MARKVLKPRQEHPDTREHSLALGSDSYMEYLLDLKDVDVHAFAQSDTKDMSQWEEKAPDEVQDAPAEPEHTAGLAGDLREAARSADADAAAVRTRQYGLRMAKIDGFGEAKAKGEALAAETPEEDDDERIRKARLADIPDIVYDDGVSRGGYVPKVLEKYGIEF